MRTKGESLNCQSWTGKSFCAGSIVLQTGIAAVTSQGLEQPQNEIPPILQPSIPAAAGTDQMPAVSSPPCLLPPAAGHCHRCCTADKLPYAGASPGCLLTAALPASHAHCFDFLRQIHLMLTLYTTALMAVGIQAPYPVLVVKTWVPAGLFNNKTSVLLLTVLLAATPPVASVVATVTFMNVVYVVCVRSWEYMLACHQGWISSVNPKMLHTTSPCRFFSPVCHIRVP